MVRLAEISRKLKGKKLYLCTLCTCLLTEIDLLFGWNEHQHQTDTHNYEEDSSNTTVTDLKYNYHCSQHCVSSKVQEGPV
jgi:hypothetical protein